VLVILRAIQLLQFFTVCDRLRETDHFLKLFKTRWKFIKSPWQKIRYLTSKHFVLEMESPILSLYCDHLQLYEMEIGVVKRIFFKL